MISQSNPIYSKISSRLTPRCMAVVVISGIIFCGIYSSVRTPFYPKVIGRFAGSPRYGWDLGTDKDAGGALKLFQWSEVDHRRLFYNRVPKCGSTTMLTLMQKLASRLGFAHFHSKIYDRRRGTEKEQRRIVHWVTEPPPPCSFDRHVFFINFTSFGERPPLYMNIIRDPVERIISSFFYRRMVAATNKTKAVRKKPSLAWLNKKFEHCVAASDAECTFNDGSNYSILQLPFFCGQEPQCQLLNEPYALQKAKQNIVDSYAVVGVLEHMNVTLKVLEAVMPQFFRGALKLYRTLGLHENKNPQKESVSEEAKLQIKANLTAEYELYSFVVQRLYDQYRQVQLS